MRHLLFLAVLLSVSACSTPKPTGSPAPQHAASTGKGNAHAELALTGPQIVTLGKLAQKGNEDAALKLVDYYALVAMDTPRAIHWCEVGAKNGSQICRHNLKVLKSGGVQ